MSTLIQRFSAAALALMGVALPAWAGQAVIPEPSTIGLVVLGLGLGGVIALRRNRKK